MKKIIIFCTIVFMVCTLSSCKSTQNKSFDVLYSGRSFDSTVLESPNEHILTTSSHAPEKKMIGDIKTITVNGVQYEGQYEYTTYKTNGTSLRKYVCGEEEVEFYVCKDTGKIRSLTLNGNLKDGITEKSEQELSKVATEYFEKIADYLNIDHADQYVLDPAEKGAEYVVYVFRRHVNGYVIAEEKIGIEIALDGSLYKYYSGYNDSKPIVPSYAESKIIDKNVEEKIKMLYDGYYNELDLSYTVNWEEIKYYVDIGWVIEMEITVSLPEGGTSDEGLQDFPDVIIFVVKLQG